MPFRSKLKSLLRPVIGIRPKERKMSKKDRDFAAYFRAAKSSGIRKRKLARKIAYEIVVEKNHKKNGYKGIQTEVQKITLDPIVKARRKRAKELYKIRKILNLARKQDKSNYLVHKKRVDYQI